MKDIFFPANYEGIEAAQQHIQNVLEAAGCSAKTAFQVDVAAEEIMVNIVEYSGIDETDSIHISYEVENNTLKLTFADKGVPYNPITKDPPDLSPEVRLNTTGGLGIYMVKQTMDDLSYEHTNGENRLTIVKKLS